MIKQRPHVRHKIHTKSEKQKLLHTQRTDQDIYQNLVVHIPTIFALIADILYRLFVFHFLYFDTFELL